MKVTKRAIGLTTGVAALGLAASSAQADEYRPVPGRTMANLSCSGGVSLIANTDGRVNASSNARCAGTSPFTITTVLYKNGQRFSSVVGTAVGSTNGSAASLNNGGKGTKWKACATVTYPLMGACTDEWKV
jgi:hypothetical protein